MFSVESVTSTAGEVEAQNLKTNCRFVEVEELWSIHWNIKRDRAGTWFP